MNANADVMVASYKSGLTLKQIGAKHGLSGEGVRLILKAQGVDRLHGGAAIRNLERLHVRIRNRNAEETQREVHSRKYWDMSRQEFLAHVEQYGGVRVLGSPMCAYKVQKVTAKKRGIGWDFTFKQWWQVWLDSGKWELRGRHSGDYVMARYGDGEAPYGPDTVYICTSAENLRDGFEYRHQRGRKKKD